MKKVRAYLKRLIIRMIIEDIRNGGELRRVIKDLSDEPYRPISRYASTRYSSKAVPTLDGPVIINTAQCRIDEAHR